MRTALNNISRVELRMAAITESKPLEDADFLNGNILNRYSGQLDKLRSRLKGQKYKSLYYLQTRIRESHNAIKLLKQRLGDNTYSFALQSEVRQEARIFYLACIKREREVIKFCQKHREYLEMDQECKVLKTKKDIIRGC